MKKTMSYNNGGYQQQRPQQAPAPMPVEDDDDIPF